MDWKEQLAAMASPQDTAETPLKPVADKPAKTAAQTLYIRYEKRNGKPATIISEIDLPQNDIKDLAKRIKQSLGIGGSSKDDEILLQGDVRAKVSAFLRAEGYRLKGEVK